MTDTAAHLRAAIATSTDKYRLEREARRAEVRGERSLVNRLVDAEHSLKLDGRYLDAADIREAVELLESHNLGGAS